MTFSHQSGGRLAALCLAAAAAVLSTGAQAAEVLSGDIVCEAGQRVRLLPDEQVPDQFELLHGKVRFRLHRVTTSTGVVRLEDAAHQVVWLQLPHKSMLMNQALGRRMLDECTTQSQMAAYMASRHVPAPQLLDNR